MAAWARVAAVSMAVPMAASTVVAAWAAEAAVVYEGAAAASAVARAEAARAVARGRSHVRSIHQAHPRCSVSPSVARGTRK